MKNLMERTCIGTQVVNPNKFSLEGFFGESVHDMFRSGPRRCFRLEAHQLDGYATSVSGVTKELRIGSNCMSSIARSIIAEKESTYASFHAHGRAVPSIADAVRCDSSSTVYLVADSLPTFFRWLDVNSDRARRDLLAWYRTIRVPGCSMTMSLLQVLGTAVKTEESHPVVIGVGGVE